MGQKSVILKKLLVSLIILVFLFTLAPTLLFNATEVKADDNMVYWHPYTKYYYCGTPGTNSYGLVHTEHGRDRTGYEDQNHPPYIRKFVVVWWPFFWAGWINVHVDHPVTYHTYPERTETIRLGRYHWRCR